MERLITFPKSHKERVVEASFAPGLQLQGGALICLPRGGGHI